MNPFDNLTVSKESFSYNDLIGQSKWENWTPILSATVVGSPAYAGRFRVVGRSVQFQAQLSAGTSIATSAGTSYLELPIAAKGYSGVATMTNNTSNVAVGVCHIDVATSRCYLPTQIASANVFTIAGWYEV